ncbi:MAG: MFS transporter [Rhodocyclaceae bacterium]
MPQNHRTTLSVWMFLGGLYTTQYLGLSFIFIALVTILREQGASLERISLIYLLGLFGACKFVWAPLVDRFRLTRRWGHYQGWLLAMQSAMVVILLLVGTFDIGRDFIAIYLLCLATALCCSTQDIAVDGLACRLLAPAQRGFGNGLQTACGLLSYLIGGGLVLMLYPVIGWRHCTWLLAAGTSLSIIQLMFFCEPPRPAASVSGRHVFLRFITFWQRERGSRHGLQWLLVLLTYSVGLSISYSILAPVLVDAGWPVARIGLVMNVLGPLIGFVSALLTGSLIHRLGRSRAMLLAALLQVVAVAAIALPVLGHTGELSVACAVCVYFFCSNPSMAVLGTLIMDHASRETPATDFTLQYSMQQFCGMAMGASAVFLAGRFGYVMPLSVAATAAFLAVFSSLRYGARLNLQHV